MQIINPQKTRKNEFEFGKIPKNPRNKQAKIKTDNTHIPFPPFV